MLLDIGAILVVLFTVIFVVVPLIGSHEYMGTYRDCFKRGWMSIGYLAVVVVFMGIVTGIAWLVVVSFLRVISIFCGGQ